MVRGKREQAPQERRAALFRNSRTGTRGLHEMERFFEDLRTLVELTAFEIRECIAQGNRVVALVHYEGRYRQTGEELCGRRRRPYAAEMLTTWPCPTEGLFAFQSHARRNDTQIP
jgi:hypothetical protein